MQTHRNSYPPAPDYNTIVQKLRDENVRKVQEELRLKSPRLMTKVDTYVDHFKFEKEMVLEKIKNDPMFAVIFAKDPTRTGVHEKEAASWLKNLPMVKEFKVLPKSGKNALYVTGDGEIRYIPNKKAIDKSIDFHWKTGKFTVYATHKFTGESGGSQDSQANGVKESLQRFRQGSGFKNDVFLAIVDGDYYTDKKMNELRDFCIDRQKLSWALAIQDVPYWLDDKCL